MRAAITLYRTGAWPLVAFQRLASAILFLSLFAGRAPETFAYAFGLTEKLVGVGLQWLADVLVRTSPVP